MSPAEWIIVGIIALLLIVRGHGDLKFNKRCEVAKQQQHVIPTRVEKS